MQNMRIGLIGLDTSHVSAFTRLLNDADNEFHVAGGSVVAGYPGGSEDMEKSYTRVEQYTQELRDQHGVAIVDSIETLASDVDAIMIESVDGRVHRAQFERVAGLGKPVFIDKPMTTSVRDAEAIADLASRSSTPVMSCSALRYAVPLQQALADTGLGSIVGADCFGPMALDATQPGWFWYGVHSVEMLFTLLGQGCQVSAMETVHVPDHDIVAAPWNDGRIGSVRGNRSGNHRFGAVIHREKGSQFVDASGGEKPFYAGLLEAVIAFFQSGHSPIDIEETLEIVRFMEDANKDM